MAIVSSGALVDLLRQYRLLSKQQLAEVLGFAQGRCSDVHLLARMLLQRGWLTVYQVNELLADHGADLVLGAYHILDRLSKGGQSEVYKARHADQEGTVALKVIRPERLTAPAVASQFLQEMEAMAELDHPNIVQFWDADVADNAYYCAMEFIEGIDLAKVVQLMNGLTPALACEYIRQTAFGLQHAHEHNLVHRDIKPANLYLVQPAAQQPTLHDFAVESAQPAARPLIKILDWGLASLRPPTGRQEVAEKTQRCHNVIGTADYLSPEQALDAKGVDIRGDIYSLGCTLYHLLTGQVPFNGTTVMQKILQHQKAEPPPVESLKPQVPPALAAIVRRMMAKQPAERFQTPVAVALALTPFCRGELPSMPALPLHPPPRSDRPLDETPVALETLGEGCQQ